VLENMRKLRPELWRQSKWWVHHNNAPFHTSFFTTEFLTKHKKVFVLHPPYFSISRLIMKLKGRQFDTIDVIEAELQAMLNTLTRLI
jgi:hypothetical protein